MPILAYDNNLGGVTFLSKYETFPRQRSHGPEYIPDPIVNTSDVNDFLLFTSDGPGMANIDWGDGYSEQYSFVGSNDEDHPYILGFKALDINYYKDPDLDFSQSGWKKADGSLWVPYPYHRYTDGIEKHTVVFRFTNKVKAIQCKRFIFYGFPILDVPELEEINFSSCDFSGDPINADKIGRSTNIKTVKIGDLKGYTSKLKNWPEGFLKITGIQRFDCNGIFDFSDIDNSNFRKLSVWKNFEMGNWNGNNIPKFVKEFLQLTKMNNLSIGTGRNDWPDFSEVDAINPSLRMLCILHYGGDAATSWKEDLITGKGLQYLRNIEAEYNKGIPVDIFPEYFKEMKSLQIFNVARALDTSIRIDTFVNTIYDYILSWDKITMSSTDSDGQRNQFYGLSVSTYRSSQPSESVRPSGTLQAPSGFIQGQSNGTPTTPMEKIYVLTNNYKQVWTLKPEEATSAAARVLTAATPYSLSIVEDRVYFGTGDMISPGEVFNFQTPEDAKRFLTSFNYPTEVIDEYVKQQNEGGPA